MFSIFNPPEVLNNRPRLVFSPEDSAHVLVLSKVLRAFLESTKQERGVSAAVGVMVVSAVDFLKEKDAKRGGTMIPPIMFSPKEGDFIHSAFKGQMPEMTVDESVIAAALATNLRALN